ncbi:MAG: STAS domain-containing protein [Acidimicrobiia bacterium]
MIETPNNQGEAPAELAPKAVVPFRCIVAFVDEDAVISVRGEIDLATAPVLLRDAQAALALPISAVNVDLREVTFVDSSGLQALLTARERALERDITFTLTAVPSSVRRVIDVTGLGVVFDS